MSAVQNISRAFQNPNRITGILLISSFLVPLLALVILITSGAFPAFSAGLQGSLAEKAPHAETFRLLNLFWTAGWILQLMGFGMLTWLLLHGGDAPLTIPAFIAVLIAAILGVLHGTFHMSVETWAAQGAARTGSVPAFYEALNGWVGSFFRVGYVAYLAGTAFFGWAIHRTRLVPTWIGRVVAGWSLLWLLGYFVGIGAPGILFFIPTLIGIGLFRYEPA